MQVTSNYAAQQASPAQQTQRTGASGRAGSDYLKELRERYPKASFGVGDVGPGGAENYAWGKAGEFNDVLIHPDALEKFANDPESASKFESQLKTFLDGAERDKNILNGAGGTITGRGMVVDENGEASYWAVGQTTRGDDGDSASQKMRKQLDEDLKKQTEAREAAKKEEAERTEKKEEAERTEKKEEAERTAFSLVFNSTHLSSDLAAKLDNSHILDVKA
jgi:hypothetical protein